jgi:hypothetical protein
MRANGIERIETKPEAKEGWVEKVNEAAKKTLAASGKTLLASGRQPPGLPALRRRHGPLSRDLCGRRYQGYEEFTLSR